MQPVEQVESDCTIEALAAMLDICTDILARMGSLRSRIKSHQGNEVKNSSEVLKTTLSKILRVILEGIALVRL